MTRLINERVLRVTGNMIIVIRHMTGISKRRLKNMKRDDIVIRYSKTHNMIRGIQ